MKRYVLGIIFDPTANHVLLIKRLKDPYKGLYNGIGGKINPNEHPDIAMLRETEEETGITISDLDVCNYLLTLDFPKETVHVYAMQVKEADLEMKTDTPEGTLKWFHIHMNDLFFSAHPEMAGDGSVAYVIQYALKHAGLHIESVNPEQTEK